MSKKIGIFEQFNSAQPSPGDFAPVDQTSPFTIVDEKQTMPGSSPFILTNQHTTSPSPFKIPNQAPRPASIPQPRAPLQSPFQTTEPQDFGFEDQQPNQQGLFTPSAVQSPAEPQPQNQNASPFAFLPAQPLPTNQPAPAPNPTPRASQQLMDSQAIRQLELRAIFGVNHELSKDDIIHRASSLPGIRQIAIVNDEDISAFDGLMRMIHNMGIPTGPIKLFVGSYPIEFIREGRILLGVQTDSGFAPGVRETLMLVARELNR